MQDASTRIRRLEDEIETMSDEVERCGKFMLAGRVAITGGGLALAGIVLGVIRMGGIDFVLAVCAILLGIVFLGSNRSTRDELRRGIEKRMQERDALIDLIAPLTVDGRRGGRLLDS
jgi:cell division ATPase FtsA